MPSTAQRLPLEIDPFRLAERGAQLSGSLPLAQMRRLAETLANTEGEVKVELEFGIDDMHIPYVRGRIETLLQLTCQRCLEACDFTVSHAFALAWVRGDRDTDRLPLQFEPFVVNELPVRLSDVVEDELLLLLPQIPMHPESQCKATAVLESLRESEPQPETETQQRSPFSELQKLKQDK
jgi:uncharacterized protein